MSGRRFLTFHAMGRPEPKGSMRMVPTGRGVRVTSDNRKLKAWQATVALEARLARKRGPAFSGPVAIAMAFYLPRPKSLSAAIVEHLTRPDLDKLVRAVGDALIGVLYADDNQVVDIHAFKRYAPITPGVIVTVMESTGAPRPLPIAEEAHP